MLRCRDIQRLTTEFLEGALGKMTRFFFKLHLLVCPSCKTHVGKMETMVGSLGQLPPGEEIPENIKQTLQNSLPNQK